jgi:hypothetical protein
MAAPRKWRLTFAVDGQQSCPIAGIARRLSFPARGRAKTDVVLKGEKAEREHAFQASSPKSFQAGPRAGFFSPTVSSGRPHVAIWFRFTGAGMAAAHRFGDGFAPDLWPPNATCETVECACEAATSQLPTEGSNAATLPAGHPSAMLPFPAVLTRHDHGEDGPLGSNPYCHMAFLLGLPGREPFLRASIVETVTSYKKVSCP